MQFVVFEKFTSAYLFQIAREKSFDYLLIIYKWQFLSRFSILRDKWRQQATSTLLDENLTCEFKRENSFTLSKSCMKTEQLLFTVKSSLNSQLNWRTWPQSKGKSPCGYDAAFLANVFRVVGKLCSRNYWTWSSAAGTSCFDQNNEAKIYQETEFHSSEGHLFNFSWLLPDLSFFTGCCTG